MSANGMLMDDLQSPRDLIFTQGADMTIGLYDMHINI